MDKTGISIALEQHHTLFVFIGEQLIVIVSESFMT